MRSVKKHLLPPWDLFESLLLNILLVHAEGANQYDNFVFHFFYAELLKWKMYQCRLFDTQ